MVNELLEMLLPARQCISRVRNNILSSYISVVTCGYPFRKLENCTCQGDNILIVARTVNGS